MPETKENVERYGILINTTEPAKSRKFVSYNVVESEKSNALTLIGVYEVAYPHPQAPENATISRLEEIELFKASKGSELYSTLYLLYTAQKAVATAIAATSK